MQIKQVYNVTCSTRISSKHNLKVLGNDGSVLTTPRARSLGAGGDCDPEDPGANGCEAVTSYNPCRQLVTTQPARRQAGHAATNHFGAETRLRNTQHHGDLLGNKRPLPNLPWTHVRAL